MYTIADRSAKEREREGEEMVEIVAVTRRVGGRDKNRRERERKREKIYENDTK